MATNSPAVIAIDGPAGSGKSTIARLLAQRLGFLYLDTGAMYRVVALLAVRNSLDPDEGEAIAALAKQAQIKFRLQDEVQHVFLDNEDVTEAIRQPQIGFLASKISVHSAVRRVLVEQQQRMGQESATGVVAEGRDTTTVVFPNARLKIFMTASPEVRARRRYLELQTRGIEADFEDVLGEVRERDHRDSTRADSPLYQAPDALRVETDNMTIEEVLEHVLSLWEERS